MADSAGQAQVGDANRPAAWRSLDMDDRQFADWAQLLEHRTGLLITSERRSFLASGIKARMRETGCASCREYYERLNSGAGQAREWSLLIDRLTVHETCFFRHKASMQLVREQLVPEVLERERGYLAWSVGCATGEESYSLAMQIGECLGGEPGERYFGVTGTDISLPSLSHARRGVYLNRRLGDIPGELQARYCTPVSRSHFRVSGHLRKRVCFAQLNLRDVARAPLGKFDLIYCQNLLIYYDRDRRTAIADRLTAFLRPGGVLILGSGELLDWRNPNMEKLRYPDTLAYRRTN